MGVRRWLRLRRPGYTVVDLETTGVSAFQHRIIEMAVVRTDQFGHVIDEWTTLINPGTAIGSARVHGITDADVAGAPRFVDVVGQLNARLAGRVLVAHNTKFDLTFLAREYQRAQLSMPHAPSLCTFEASKLFLPDLERRRLADCCAACGIRLTHPHTALGDARATAALLAYYLNPNIRLVRAAAQVAWPKIAIARAKSRPRYVMSTTAVPPGTLTKLIDQLPMSEAIDDSAPADTGAYLELLARVLADDVLTVVEAQALRDAAMAYSLTKHQLDEAHRSYLFALAQKAVADGVVSKAEREALTAAAEALDLGADLVQPLLDQATAERMAQLVSACQALPANWAYNPPLRISDTIAFAGVDPDHRRALMHQAWAAGLRVSYRISPRVAALVNSGADPQPARVAQARRLGVRVVNLDEFAELVHYIQPPLHIQPPQHIQPPLPTPPQTPPA